MDITTRTFRAGRGWDQPLPTYLDGRRTLVVAFGAPGYGEAPAPLAELRHAFPQATLVGCSTAGEILGDKLLDDHVVVAVTRFEHTDLASAAVDITSSEGSGEAGRALAERLPHADLRGVLVVSDGRRVNGSALVRELQTHLPKGVVITGGLAGDGTRFRSTWVLEGGHPVPGRIVAVGLYGARVRVRHGSRGGWDRFGPERIVTRSKDNILYELDGQPALQLYKEYLGERVRGLPATALLFPLAVRCGDDAPLVRTILDIDEAEQSMIFAGDIPTGAKAQLMRANFDRLVQGASDAADEAVDAGFGGPTLNIAVSCVGRRLVLRERTEEELEAALEPMRPDAVQIGFYSYGEISPLADGTCSLHNQTMTLTVIGET